MIFFFTFDVGAVLFLICLLIYGCFKAISVLWVQILFIIFLFADGCIGYFIYDEWGWENTKNSRRCISGYFVPLVIGAIINYFYISRIPFYNNGMTNLRSQSILCLIIIIILTQIIMFFLSGKPKHIYITSYIILFLLVLFSIRGSDLLLERADVYEVQSYIVKAENTTFTSIGGGAAIEVKKGSIFEAVDSKVPKKAEQIKVKNRNGGVGYIDKKDLKIYQYISRYDHMNEMNKQRK